MSGHTGFEHRLVEALGASRFERSKAGDLIAHLKSNLDRHLATRDGDIVSALHGTIHQRDQLHNQVGSL